MLGKEGETMTGENRFHDIDPQVYRKEFSEPIHRVGMITCGLAILGMFLPPAWLYFQYGVFPPLSAIMVGMGLALTYAFPSLSLSPSVIIRPWAMQEPICLFWQAISPT